ncbi:MAG: hypothetical protein WBB29_19465 [Geitlerinemataceae cyanobacterium]
MSYESDRGQCLEKLIWATRQLELDVELEQLSQIAELIVQTMTGCWRSFHTPEHIFMVGGEQDAIEVLAALFHDVVYVQVDRVVNFNLSYYIAPYVREVRGQLFIRKESELPEDPTFRKILAIFNMAPGLGLSPTSGQNEFLSALVAAKVLESFLSRAQVVQIVTIIESTIPFRPKDDKGNSAIERLYRRLIQVNQDYHLQMSDADIEATIRRSVRLSNRDVGGFADPSSAQFLDNTWSLLPETNHHLHYSGSYTISQYRQALQKMESFMGFLKPELIFHQFQGEPDEASFKKLLSGARNNLEVSRLYLGSKLTAIAILEALSLRFGQDVPLTTMMGELPSENVTCANLVDFLPDIPNAYPLNTPLEEEVFGLLEKGRYRGADYDLNNSPMATYMVKFLGFNEIERLRKCARDLFDGTLSGEAFLAECHPQVVEVVTDSILKLFDSRKASLAGTEHLAIGAV